MPTCDKCKCDTTVRFVIGNTKLCEKCYGPRLVKPANFTKVPGGFVFKPYYHSKLGYVGSAKQEEKLLREKGVSYISDWHKAKKEAEYIRKHKEEHIQSQYAKDGIKYTPHSNTVFDETNGRFIPRR